MRDFTTGSVYDGVEVIVGEELAVMERLLEDAVIELFGDPISTTTQVGQDNVFR
jgi:hypothetical protein